MTAVDGGTDTDASVVDSTPPDAVAVDADAGDAAPDAVRVSCETNPDVDGDGSRAIECGGDDCDDNDASRYPGNREVCDGRDRDEDCDPETFGARDGDGDGYPDIRCCNTAASGMRFCGDDCDDTRGVVHPSEAESCDMLDNDCNGHVDDGLLGTFYRDLDGDDFGDDEMTMTGCRRPSGYAARGGDCDDSLASRNPGAPEVPCDDVDNNCDGSLGPSDRDRDGFDEAPSGLPFAGCSAGTGTDCDDTNAYVYPGAVDVCDGARANCNVPHDEFEDFDSDGYVAATAMCVGGPYGDGAVDCAPMDARRYPGAPERCNGLDDDCDGAIDEATDETISRTCFERAMTGPGVVAACASGGCVASACEAGTTDCDANLTNGCSDLTTSGRHCGRCGNACGFACRAGAACDPAARVHVADTDFDDRVTVVTESGALFSFRGVRYPQAERIAVPGVVIDAETGSFHGCARTVSNELWCWTIANQNLWGGRSALIGTAPTRVTRVTNVVDLEIRDDVTCALEGRGRLCCWNAGVGLYNEACRDTTLTSLTAISFDDRYDGSCDGRGCSARGHLPRGQADRVCGVDASGAACFDVQDPLMPREERRAGAFAHVFATFATPGDASLWECYVPLARSAVECFYNGSPRPPTALANVQMADTSCALAGTTVSCRNSMDVLVPALNDVRQFSRNCGVRTDGRVTCWDTYARTEVDLVVQ